MAKRHNYNLPRVSIGHDDFSPLNSLHLVVLGPLYSSTKSIV